MITNKNVFKAALSGAAFVAAAILMISPVSADSGCQPIYGGGQTCAQNGNVSINKTVANPSTNVFVDNLGINDPRFGADNTVTFKLTVKNTGAGTLSHVDVKDILPPFVVFVSGPGNFDANSKTISFGLDNLQPNEARDFTIMARVLSTGQINDGVTCVVNQAFATSNGQTSSDNSQFCIEKTVTPPTETKGGQPVTTVPETKGGLKVFPPVPMTVTPPTGPETLPLLAMIPTAIAGLILRKKAA